MWKAQLKMRWKLLLLLGLLLMPLAASAQNDADELVNLDHLRFLTEPVTIDGREMAVVHIYSEYPDYEWVDAAGEGLSAVDDVARAAVVYLWEFERTGEADLLDEARRCLEFVLYMQADDGEFYNFVTDSSGTINRTGGTSYKSLGWWAMRGLWALGEGVRVFDQLDPEYADRLSESYLRTEAALGGTMGNYGETFTIHGFDVPAWIPGGEPAVASVGLLGLSAYYQARPNETTADIMTKIADGISQYRLGDHSTYPFGMHPVASNAPGFFHDWGAHMTHALVVAGMALDRQDWIDSAAADANSFLLRQLVFERFRNMGVIPNRLEQIAYGTNMLVQTYAALYRATGDETYAEYAGLAASWYFGNNMAETQVYFPETGVVYDGINGPVSWRVNRNSGAESTIEGLMSLIAIADMPQAVDLLHVEPVSSTPWQILEAETAERVVGTPVYYAGNWTGEGYISGGRYIGLGEGQRMRLQFEVEQEGDYLLYVAHMRQSTASGENVVQRAAEPPTIDGSAEDWSESIASINANTAQQFLRGAGLWQGADVDSHSVRLSWDDDNLYVFADVRDPQFDQQFTLSAAGQGDNLWLYFTNSADASRLSAKVTLAQTPDGAQIWDWQHAGFFEGGMLAFQQDEGGYSYEAALPWASLGVDMPQAGMQIGFEAGRGVGGYSFMDLTGRDPDVAANLLHLMLVEPGMDTAVSTTPQVALEVRFADEDEVIIPETVSPDSDFFWLDLVTPQPVHLLPGETTIRFGYAGEELANPGSSKVDAFYLQPAVAQRVWQTPDGRTISLSYDTMTGKATWDEAG
jgi:hypothetical protein